MSPLLPGLLDSLCMPQLSLQLHALRLPAPVASAFQLGDGSVRWGRLAAAALAALALGSQLWWLRLRAQYGLPAPLWRPLFGAGALLEMVLDPVGFWDARAAQARSDRRGMCLDYLLGHPLVFVTDTALSQKVSPAVLSLC